MTDYEAFCVGGACFVALMPCIYESAKYMNKFFEKISNDLTEGKKFRDSFLEGKVE